MKKKLLFITNIQSPYRIDFFNEIGGHYDVTVWFQNTKSNREWNIQNLGQNFRYRFFNFEEHSILLNIKNIIKEINSSEFDYYIIGQYNLPISIIAMICLKLKNKPIIINSDGGFIKKDKKIVFIIKKMLMSMGNHWLSTGKNCTDYMEFYGAKQKNIYEYPFASVSYQKNLLKPIPEKDKDNIKSDLGLNKIVILTVASFIELKGLDTLIKAFEILQKENKDVSLILIGGGELKEKYEEYINSNNIKNVRILEFIQKDKLVNYYKISDIFVFPTRGDVWGLVINEAMSFGLPIISSNNAGAGLDLVQNNVNGYNFTTDDIEDLYMKLKILSNNKELRSYFSKNSLEIIKKFTVQAMAKKHIKILENLY